VLRILRKVYSEVKEKGEKCKVVPAFNSLSTTPWSRVEEWRHSSTVIDLGVRWSWMVSSKPRPLYAPKGKCPMVVIGYEAKWAPESVWTLRNREKSLTFTGNRTLAVHIVCRYVDWAIPTQGDETIKLRLFLESCAVRKGGEGNWLRIVCNIKQGPFLEVEWAWVH
jgi:hypothetical protein